MTDNKDRGVRLTFIEKALGFVAAILALATAILGYKAATLSQAKDQVQASSSSQVSDLQARIQQLQTENRQLRSQVNLSTPSASPQAPPVATVRHSGHLTLASFTYADLDAPSSDPQWASNNGTGSPDLYNAGTGLDPQYYAAALALGSTQATYDRCRNQTGYSATTRLKYGSMSLGQYFCWKTTDGRYAALRLTQLANSSVTFDVVVYDPPG
jgi:outer membrane murein-binding lipoprotein Lpp